MNPYLCPPVSKPLTPKPLPKRLLVVFVPMASSVEIASSFVEGAPPGEVRTIIILMVPLDSANALAAR